LLLQFLAREIADAALLVVCTYRDVEVGRRHPLVEALAELAREPVSRVVGLRGLSRADVARFMEVVGGSRPPAAIVAAIHQRTDGNPFFVSELVRLLAPDGNWVRTPQAVGAAIPLGVQEVISARLARLSAPCRSLLQIAAVAGREFDTRVVAMAAGGRSQPGDATPEPLLAPLEEALRQRMIVEVASAACTYSFSHALIRDALCAELSSSERMRMHRRIGEALEAFVAAGPQTHLAELAYHFVEGSAGGDDDGKAAAYARRAAEHAHAALAYEEAARCYDLALRALRRQGADERQQCELLLAMGNAHEQASDRTASRAVYEQAVELARRLGERELLARAALGSAGVIASVETDPQVVATLEEGLAALRREDSGLRAMLLARLAMELFYSPDSERRAALSAEAVATARRAGDDLALIHALEARHFALWNRTGPLDRLTIANEMMRLATEVNSAERLMHGHHLSIGALLELGRIDDVDAVIATYAELADQLRQPGYHWGVTMCRALRATIDGRFEEAEAFASAAFALGQSVQPETAANFLTVQIFFLRREQGRLAELEDAMRGAVATYPHVRAWRATLAYVYAENGRRADAAHELEQAACDDFRYIADDNNRVATLAMLAETSALLADRARAAALYAHLLPHADLVIVAGISSACAGSVRRPLGVLAATLERWDEAVDHFERALAVHRRLASPPFVARTQLEYAAALLAARDADARDRDDSLHAAHALLGNALTTARALGMAGVAARAETLMGARDAGDAAGSAPRRAVAPAGGTPDDVHAAPDDDAAASLFRRDGEYWVVTFEGHTCRLKDAKGLGYIAQLLHDPNRSFHVTELLREPATGGAAPEPPDDARTRLRELWAELEEAERCNDPGSAARAQAEIEALTGELTRRMGLEPGSDRAGAASQLLRLRITKAIKAAARKISTQHPALGHHLRTTIRTGSLCTYVPDPTKPIRWR
jgi:tetratricopeptide (TPR) repeat protein